MANTFGDLLSNTTLTPGSVLFYGSASLLQDNDGINYNDSLNRLSVFTTLGSEVVANGTFTGSATSWTVPAGMAYSSNSVSKTSNGTGALTQSLAVSNLREYLLTFVISNYTAGTVTPSVGSFTGTAVSANGTYTERFVSPANPSTLSFTPSNTARFTIDTVSVKPLTGTNNASNLNVGGLSVEGAWSNGTPGTTRGMTINNDGSYSWTDYRFSGVLKSAIGADSSGSINLYHSGSIAYYQSNSGLTSNNNYSYQTSTLYYHQGYIYIGSNGLFGGMVHAGSVNTPTSTLQSAGGTALKVKRITASQTLDNTATHWLCDATTAAACTGTPSQTACSTYTGSGQGTCESHLPCTWYAGASCSAFDNESGMGTCSGTSGCTVVTSSCSAADNTSQSTCEDQDNSYGGSCSWDTTTCPAFTTTATCNAEPGCTATEGNNCSAFTDTASCNAQTPCVATEGNNCTAFDDNYSGCTGQTPCSWSGGGYDCSLSDGTDQGTCEGNSGCTWDSGDNTCKGTCSGSYFSSCDGMYFSSCSGNLCNGDYNTGSCTGTYGTACNGTVSCSSYSSSGPCGAETGCTWASVLNATLPAISTYPDRTYWVLNDASGGADTVLLPQAGETINGTSSLTLAAYKDGVHVAPYHDLRSCSEFVTSGACTPTGCSVVNANCSWDGGGMTCSGNAVCVGLGDQSTCEAQTYFNYCDGQYTVTKNWHVWSRT